ncbi:uncharacterized protein LOC141535585 [Cotesia typhae]|uniref:uncharacterized protein LOC141535585 n=1 Tax=Cotesia typhae TaxID=2053667 RepID=UPI003D688AA9
MHYFTIRFFGTVRQASGSNDHPTFPTFLQIYKILSIFNILKPPKSGNCTVLSKESLITLTELKCIYSQKSLTEPSKNISILKEKLKQAVKIDDSGDDHFLNIIHDHGYNESDTVNCILYYATEVVVSRIYKKTTCEQCRKGIRDYSVDSNGENILLNNKCDENFIHPNLNFYNFIKLLEKIFIKHCESLHIYEDVMAEAIASDILKFPCNQHAGELLLSAITYYIRLRMQQYTSQINKNTKKMNQLKKKQAKFCSN